MAPKQATGICTHPKLRAFVPPCETPLLLALRSMTRHKDQHDAILTRSNCVSNQAIIAVFLEVIAGGLRSFSWQLS